MPFIVPNQTSYALERPIYTGTTWTRPADWITITDTTGEVQFLVSDLAAPSYRINTTYTRTLGTQRIYIDWGDGVIDTISATTATDTSHTYTSGGTPCSLGYNTWKIRIYGDAGTRITTAFQLVPAPYFNSPNNPLGGTIIQAPNGLLEAYYGDTTILSAQFLFSYSVVRPRFSYLQYCKLPSVMTGSGNILENAFGDCNLLQKVVMPTSMPNNTSTRDLFTRCWTLQEVVFPQDMINLTDMTNTFSTCYELKSITLPPTLNLVSTIAGAFSSCYLLSDLDFIPPLPANTSFNGSFASCRSLISANIKVFRNTGTIDFTTAFANCVALEYVNLPVMTPGTLLTFTQSFANCSNLKSFIAPTNFDTTTLGTAFQNCVSLSSCILPSSIPNCATMSSTFQGCSTLQSFTFPTTMAVGGVDINNCFFSCLSLSEITIPNTILLRNTLVSTFQGCANLTKVSLPPLSGTNITNLQSLFNGCFNLQEHNITTFPPNLTNTSTMFLNTLNISGFTFPNAASINNISSMFPGESGIQSVSLPSSMPLLTNASALFNSNRTIKSVVMPTTTGNITTYANFANGSQTIQSITLPTTQSTALTSLTAAFQNTYSLTGITNLDKLGDPSTSSTIYIDGNAAFYQAYKLTSIDLYCKFSKFGAYGTSNLRLALTSLRLRNNGAGQYAGTSPQIDISYTSLGQAALVQVFNDLPTITAKTINITGSIGAASLTPAERAIATGKGWTIVG